MLHTPTSPGDGPRMAVKHPGRDFIYCLTELTCRVVVYEIDAKYGTSHSLSTSLPLYLSCSLALFSLCPALLALNQPHPLHYCRHI